MILLTYCKSEKQRDPEEVRYVQGQINGEIAKVLISPENSPVVNYGFDVTPSKYVTGLITERGVCTATVEGITALYQEKK